MVNKIIAFFYEFDGILDYQKTNKIQYRLNEVYYNDMPKESYLYKNFFEISRNVVKARKLPLYKQYHYIRVKIKSILKFKIKTPSFTKVISKDWRKDINQWETQYKAFGFTYYSYSIFGSKTKFSLFKRPNPVYIKEPYITEIYVSKSEYNNSKWQIPTNYILID